MSRTFWRARTPGKTAIEARDVEGIGDFLHPDYALVLVKPADVSVPRAEWLRMLPDYVVHGYSILARRADVDDDVALVLQIVDQQATVPAAIAAGSSSCPTAGGAAADGAWRVWRRNSTPLDAGAMPRE